MRGKYKLAPIGVSVYARKEHLKKTVDALKKNKLAQESVVYFFSDAPKRGDGEKVYDIRRYLKSLNGFKEIHIIERNINNRIFNNREGIKYLLNKYGKLIWLEEDIVTAPGFLIFMNEALNFYRDDPKIISITGYSPPLNVEFFYKQDVYVLRRFNAWGFATWKEKFNLNEIYKIRDKMREFFLDRVKVREFLMYGEDMEKMLLKEYKGELDALDVKVMFYQYLNDLYTVYPKKSLVQNIGFDGTGVHCGVTNKFWHNKLWDKVESFEFIKNIQPDERIIKANYKFRKVNFKTKLAYFFKNYDKLYKFLKYIKNKL